MAGIPKFSTMLPVPVESLGAAEGKGGLVPLVVIERRQEPSGRIGHRGAGLVHMGPRSE